MGRPFRCARRRPRIHKPSKAVSFGLPDRLSFGVQEHAMVTADRGANLDREKRQGQAATRPDPPSFGECNGCEDEAPTGKTQEIKGEPDASLCGFDIIGSHAKPDQYGRRIRHLGDGAARSFGRQAFLTDRSSQMRGYGILPRRARLLADCDLLPRQTSAFNSDPCDIGSGQAISVAKPFSRSSKSS